MNRSHHVAGRAVVLLIILFATARATAQEQVAPKEKYRAAIEKLDAFIERERAAKAIPAISIALVDDQEVVWAKGFGMADAAAGIAASATTVHRVGSVSKLYTDVAIMQLVEQGKLDLDAPIQTYLPEFRPKNPYDKPINLRMLMSHRSGLVREAPIGHYFDPTAPSLADTVASLNQTTLVYEPTARTKYSNAAIASVGYVLEKTQGEPFAKYIQRAVLDPIGMASSGYELTPELEKSLANAQMWTYDGRVFDAPKFPIAMLPAGNLYSTVLDQAKFLSVLFAGGKTHDGKQLIKKETLHAMWKPQFEREGATSGFGLGFMVSRTASGALKVGHNGAVYGFATDVSALPSEKLGAAVVSALDCANGTSSRIAREALELLQAARDGKPLPEFVSTEPVKLEQARELRGRFRNGESGPLDWDIAVDSRGKVKVLRANGGYAQELRNRDGALVFDDCLSGGGPFQPSVTLDSTRDHLTMRRPAGVNPNVLDRVDQSNAPRDVPEAWRGLIGEYGWDHDVLYILERDGKLWALIEWFEFNPLEQESENVFTFPGNRGLYHGEKLIFKRDASGRATEVEAASVVFKRRPIDGENGKTFQITPVRPVAELRKDAIVAQPPSETGDFRKPDLVDLTSLDPAIKLDIRYATDNNFAGTPFYSSARAFMQKPAAEALLRAHQKLKEKGFGLLIHDAYRPWYVTRMFWDATPQKHHGFVADPSKGSKHNRGCAVDLTLYDLKTGKAVEMVGGYDEFSDRSNPDYPGGTSLARWHRDTLRGAMEAEGFSVYELEWWHFDFRDWAKYPILNLPFEAIR